MTRATKDAHGCEKKSTNGELLFLRSLLCTPIPLSEPDQISPKVYDKRRLKNYLEGFFEVLAPRSNILKDNPTISTIREPGKAIVSVQNGDIEKLGTQQERQTP